MTPAKFKNDTYLNWFFRGFDKLGRPVPKLLAPAWLESAQRHQLSRMTYIPGKPRIFEGELNRWLGWGSEPIEGDIAPWVMLLDFLFPGAESAVARRWLEQWLAFPVQHPGTKLATAVVLHSPVEGVGKSILAECVGKVYGKNFQLVGEDQLVSTFNSWQADKQLVLGEEITGDGASKRTVANRLKSMITQATVLINEKYVPAYSIPDVVNYIFLSNNPDSFYLTDQSRRYFVWRVDAAKPQSAAFYDTIRQWKNSAAGASALHHYLKYVVDVGDFNPAAGAMETSARAEMIELGLSEVERWAIQLRDNRSHVLLTRSGVPDLGILFSLVELLQLYDPVPRRNQVGVAALSRALEKAGFRRVYRGQNVTLKTGSDAGRKVKLWAITMENPERFWKMDHGSLAEHYEKEQNECRRLNTVGWDGSVTGS